MVVAEKLKISTFFITQNLHIFFVLKDSLQISRNKKWKQKEVFTEFCHGLIG